MLIICLSYGERMKTMIFTTSTVSSHKNNIKTPTAKYLYISSKDGQLKLTLEKSIMNLKIISV